MDFFSNLLGHAREVASYSLLVGGRGIPTTAIVLREFITLDTAFTAFSGKMPIAAERRYFISRGQVLCHHPYWTEDSILSPSVSNWRTRLKRLNELSPREVAVLSAYAGRVAKIFPDSWSIDFARTATGTWLLIDMAPAACSSRPEPHCVHCSQIEVEP